MPDPTDIRFPNRDVFNETIKAVHDSSEEQARIERAIGRAFLDRLAGKTGDLAAAYASIGGHDPVAKQMFSELNTKFASINLAGAKAAAAVVANKPSVAGSKGSIAKDNPVFRVEHTALRTLAELGGAEFAKKFNIH